MALWGFGKVETPVVPPVVVPPVEVAPVAVAPVPVVPAPVATPVEVAPPPAPAPSPVIYTTVFHRLVQELPQDLQPIIQKYPVISVIAMIAFVFFGVSTIFHLSISAIVTGSACVALGVAFGMGMSRSADGLMGTVWKAIKGGSALLRQNNPPAPEEAPAS